MSARRAEENAVWAGLLFIVVLGLAIGVLPWAILGGLAVAAVVYWLTREWGSALNGGYLTAAVILILGLMSRFSPGWYQGLL